MHRLNVVKPWLGLRRKFNVLCPWKGELFQFQMQVTVTESSFEWVSGSISVSVSVGVRGKCFSYSFNVMGVKLGGVTFSFTSRAHFVVRGLAPHPHPPARPPAPSLMSSMSTPRS